MHARLIERVASAARELLGDAQVVLFGSAARGQATASSDVDILIVSARIPQTAAAQAKLAVALEDRAGLPLINAVEFHLATPKQAAAHPIYRAVLSSAKKLKSPNAKVMVSA